MMSFLTSLLPLPRLCPAVLGLPVAVIGFAAPAQESRTPFVAVERLPAAESWEEALPALVAGPDLPDLAPRAARLPFSGPPTPSFQPLADGTTLVTIHWDTSDGETTERRSAELVLPALPVPEPTPIFLGACAGCVFLLYRRRAEPSKLRSARVNFSVAVPAARRRTRRATVTPRRSALAPPAPPALRRDRPGSIHAAYLGRLFPRQPRLERL